MKTDDIMSQIEMNKAIIQRYFDAYNNKNGTLFDEIISSDYIDHGQTTSTGLPGRGIDGAKKLIASSTDPSSLILNLIGEEHVEEHLSSSIKRMEWGDSIFGIYLALNGALEYKSGQEILSNSAQVHISPPGLEYFSKIFYECRSGKLPSNPLPIRVTTQ